MGAGVNASDFIGAWRQGCPDFCIGFTLNCKHNHILSGDTDQFSSGLCFEAIPNMIGPSLFHDDGLNSHSRARVCISNRIFDSITIAMNVEQVKNVEEARVTLVCSCIDHLGSSVLAGHLHQEEDLYRRSDIARHTRRYLENAWVYPLAVSS